MKASIGEYFQVLIFVMAIYPKTHSQECIGASLIDLSVNNIELGLLTLGNLWTNADYEANYFYPAGAETFLIYAGGIFVSGEGIDGAIYNSGVGYGPTGSDYSPGPVADNVQCEDWDRFWVVNESTIEAHLEDISDGELSIQREEIFGWPARGNNYFAQYYGFELPESESPLAPFVDINSNGIYEPDQGEYPNIKGDQMIWWVVNDLNNPDPKAERLGVEIQYAAYASNRPGLENNTYYDVKIIIKKDNPIEKFYASIWVDGDIGCSDDDYIGYSTPQDMVYFYNQDDVDGINGHDCNLGSYDIPTYKESIPMLGVALLEDQPYGVGYTAMTYNNRIREIGLGTRPNLNFAKGIWPDGTPMTRGGYGYNPGSTDTTKFAFTDAPNDPDGWSMCSAGEDSDDRRIFMTTGGYSVQAEDVIDLSFVVLVADNITYPCPSIDPLIDALNNSRTITTNLNNVVTPSSIKVFPAVTEAFVTIQSRRKLHTVTVMSLDGRLLTTFQNLDATTHSIDLSGYPIGGLLLLVIDEYGHSAHSLITKL